jgi:uncharacterized damage-inducible protein DinB
MKKTLLFVLLPALPALAQSTLHDTLVKHWKTTTDFTLAVANAMPADSYNYRPVPEELSFGQLMVQVAAANLNACSTASGMPRIPVPPEAAAAQKSPDVDKAIAIKFLTDTFKFCNDAVASITPEKLDAVVGTTRKMTGYEWLWSYFTHTAHHRGQAEVYLRMKGIVPPTYTF